MANYATNNDIVQLVPSILDHGIEDFTDELTNATLDVQRDVEIEWLKRDFSTGDNNLRFDAELLDSTQWKRATMYRALANYIMPRLSPFREGDAFQLQMKMYKELYAEEKAAEFARGIRYDLDNDGTYDENKDYFEAAQDRLYR